MEEEKRQLELQKAKQLGLPDIIDFACIDNSIVGEHLRNGQGWRILDNDHIYAKTTILIKVKQEVNVCQTQQR